MRLPVLPVRAAAVSLAAAATALAPLAAPAQADPDPRPNHQVVSKGPTYWYAHRYSETRTKVVVVRRHHRTVVDLYVRGFPRKDAGRAFGAHVHLNKCGLDPKAAGPHYQNPGAHPWTPLRKKEVWLDVKIERDGSGHSRAVVPWKIAPGTARSVIVHAEPTDPRTGDAGERLICTDVPF